MYQISILDKVKGAYLRASFRSNLPTRWYYFADDKKVYLCPKNTHYCKL